MKIYTKKGDKGQTSLFGGKRVLKSDLRVEAYGSIDELNSLIGVVVSLNQKSKIKNQKYISKIKNELIKVQKDLFKIGSMVANSNSERLLLHEGATLTKATLTKRIKEFEKLIDDLSAELPQLKNFILPGGGETGSILHFCRSVCRRTERRVVALSQKEKIDPSIITYINRLSDLLFVMARFINYKEGEKEIIWSKR